VEESLSDWRLGPARRSAATMPRADPRVDLDVCHVLHAVSVVCVPLWRGGQTVGVLNVNSSGRGPSTTAMWRH